MNKIKVVHVPVGEEARVVEIDDSLKAMQSLVGGHIEHHSMGGDVGLICNEDGLFQGLTQNGCGILGPYFFVKTDPYSGDSLSLTDEEINAIKAHVAMFRQVKHSGKSDIEVTSFNSFEEMQEYMANQRRNVINGLN